MKQILLITFTALSFWSAYPSHDIPSLTGSTFKASLTKLEILKYKLLGYRMSASARITFDSPNEFTYKSCSSSTPLKGQWHISKDTIFLEGEHPIFPHYYLIKSKEKIVSKRKIRQGELIVILKKE